MIVSGPRPPLSRDPHVEAIVVQSSDHINADTNWTRLLTGTVVSAVPKLLGIHGRDHATHAAATFGLASWQQGCVGSRCAVQRLDGAAQ